MGRQWPLPKSARSESSMALESAVLVLSVARDVTSAVPILQALVSGALCISDSIRQYKADDEDWKEFESHILHTILLIYHAVDVSVLTGANPLTQDISRLSQSLGEINFSILEAKRSPGLKRLLQLKARPRILAGLKEKFKMAVDTFSLASSIDIRQRLTREASYLECDSLLLRTTSPTKPAIFFGRDNYIATVAQKVTEAHETGSSARITINGAGGLGKTTAAVALMHNFTIQTLFRDKRHFISCEAMLTPAHLLAAIADCIDIPTSQRNLLAMIKQSLSIKGKASLLVLDNFETCWASHRKVEMHEILKHLASISQLTIIVTMRDIDQPGGIIWDPVPDLQVLDLSAARLVFLSIAGQDSDAPLLDDLLHSVDCLPLAVSLLAQLAKKGQSVETIHRRWQLEHTALLSPDGEERQYNLDASITMSLRSRQIEENIPALRLLSVLSLLPDGLSPEALEGICIMSKTETYRAAFTLRSASLAHHNVAGTLQMLAPVRLHVGNHRPPSNDDKAKVRDYFLSLLEPWNDITHPASASKSAFAIEQEKRNVHSVLSKMREEDSDIEEVGRGVLAFSKFLYSTWQPLDLLQELLHSHKDQLPCELRAACLQMLGMDLHMRCDYATATPLISEAKDLYSYLDDSDSLGSCLWSLGDMCRSQGRYAEARKLFRQSSMERSNLGNEALAGESSLLISEGDMLGVEGKCEEALANFEQARHNYTALGDDSAVRLCYQLSTTVEKYLENYNSAEKSLRRILEESRESDDSYNVGGCLFRLGSVYASQGELTKARSCLEDGLQTAQSQGQMQTIADCKRFLGDIACKTGSLEEASIYLGESYKIYEILGDQLHIADCQVSLAKLSLAKGDQRSATFLVSCAMTGFETIPCPKGLARCALLSAKIMMLQDKHSDAAGLYRKAEGIYSSIGNFKGASRCGFMAENALEC